MDADVAFIFILIRLDKGALTPKSFANIVRLILNLSFIKIKLVSKDQSG